MAAVLRRPSAATFHQHAATQTTPSERPIPRAVALSASRRARDRGGILPEDTVREAGSGIREDPEASGFSLHWFHWKNSSATPRSGREAGQISAEAPGENGAVWAAPRMVAVLSVFQPKTDIPPAGPRRICSARFCAVRINKFYPRFKSSSDRLQASRKNPAR